jgi:hypothetical protein
LNSAKSQAFLKIATRAEASNIRNYLNGYSTGKHSFNIGWGCGYGPREHFNYTEGYTMFPLANIPAKDIPFIESSPPRGGGPVKGGTVIEEPNVPIEVALSSRGSATAPRKGLVMPPRIEQRYRQENDRKRMYGDDEYEYSDKRGKINP